MSFTIDDLDQIRAYYQEGLKQHGSGAKAVHWTRTHAQEVRFQVLTEIGDLTGKKILDVGCGLGDFYAYLSRFYDDIDYTGIDIVPESISQAKTKCVQDQRYPDTMQNQNINSPTKIAPQFLLGNLDQFQPGSFDYCFASGTFTYKIPDYKHKYFALIEQMFEISREGIGFNMLEEDSFENPLYAMYNKNQVYSYFKNVTSKVHLIDGYTDDDFTLFMYKKHLTSVSLSVC